jgi:LysR family transcriptional regulator, hypochlorite-specific transcription factor HypT
MQTKWLEDFIALANMRSLARAAEARFVTQPAYGRRIKALEAWLGVALIDRSSYPTQLTPAGDAFVATAQGLLSQLDRFKAEHSEAHPNGTKVRIATGRTLGQTLFPPWLLRMQAALRLRNPPRKTTDVGAAVLDVDIVSGSLHDALLKLEHREVDLVFCYGHPSLSLALDPGTFSSLTVAQEHLVCVSAPNARGAPLHALAKPTVAALPGTVAHIALADSLALARIWANTTPTSIKAQLRSVHRADFAEPLVPLVRAGLGLAWLPLSLVAEDLKEGRLVRVGAPAQDAVCEVNLVRLTQSEHAMVDTLWEQSQAMAMALR